MAVLQSDGMKICTFNLHGLSNSNIYLRYLCNVNDLVFIQEHWLMNSQLDKLGDVHEAFDFYASSAMDKICSEQLLKGRPFGGVGVLVRKSISAIVKVVGFHPDSRVIATTISHNNWNLLCFGVYLPCDDGSCSYNDRLSDILGFIECTAELYPGFKCIILGDFNFECCGSKRGFRTFTPLMNDLNLCVCDHMDSNSVGYTYSHNTLNQCNVYYH